MAFATSHDAAQVLAEECNREAARLLSSDAGQVMENIANLFECKLTILPKNRKLPPENANFILNLLWATTIKLLF